jgi:hypothetical protein
MELPMGFTFWVTALALLFPKEEEEEKKKKGATTAV